MRFQQFINETTNVEEIYTILQKDCKPFIQEAKKLKRGEYLFRGLKKGAVKELTKKYPRKDRKPRDIPIDIQEYIDEKFKKKFGWKARSEGVFCYLESSITIHYGYPNFVFPIGKFDYLWNDYIFDLFAFLPDEFDRAIQKIDDYFGYYTNKNLNKAGNQEIMLNCPKGYYIIQYSGQLMHYLDEKIKGL